MPVFTARLVPKVRKNSLGTAIWDKHLNEYRGYKNKNDLRPAGTSEEVTSDQVTMDLKL